jgi:hypothetical protein
MQGERAWPQQAHGRAGGARFAGGEPTSAMAQSPHKSAGASGDCELGATAPPPGSQRLPAAAREDVLPADGGGRSAHRPAHAVSSPDAYRVALIAGGVAGASVCQMPRARARLCTSEMRTSGACVRVCVHAQCAVECALVTRMCAQAHAPTPTHACARRCARHASPLADFNVAWQGRRSTWHCSRSTL